MKSRETETGCGRALVIIGGIIIVVCAVALALFITHLFGLWPDWAIEFELLVNADPADIQEIVASRVGWSEKD